MPENIPRVSTNLSSIFSGRLAERSIEHIAQSHITTKEKENCSCIMM